MNTKKSKTIAVKPKRVPNKKSKLYGRVTVDLPPELYDILRKRVKQNGQTFKGYLTNLIAVDFDYDLYPDE